MLQIKHLVIGEANQLTEEQRTDLQLFLSRMALWANELGLKEEWPAIDLSDKLGLEAMDNSYEAEFEKFSGLMNDPFVLKLLKGALHWQNAAKPVELAHPDPYEPLINYWKSGGRIRKAHDRTFQLHHGALPIHPFEHYLPKEGS